MTKKRVGRPPKKRTNDIREIGEVDGDAKSDKIKPIDPMTGGERQKRFVTVLRAEAYWVEKARSNPAFFHHYLLGKEPALHHKMWYSRIFNPNIRRLNLIAPRESAKTSVALVAMTWLIGKAPLLTNMILSVSAAQAEQRRRVIAGYISENPRFHNVFPDVYLDMKLPNTQVEFTVYSDRNGVPYNVWRSLVDRLGNPKDPTLFAAGVGGKGVIGRRISGLVLLDDIIDETYLSASAQEKAEQYLMQTVIPCVQESGKVVNIGTRWMIDDVPQRLLENPEWESLVIHAMEPDEKGEMRSYWPEFWPVEKLEAKKREMNNEALFEIMYQSNPLAMTANAFTRESISQPLPFPLPKIKQLYIGSDQAVSLKRKSDFNVYMAIGIDEAENVYLLDGIRFKLPIGEQITELSNFVDRIAFQHGKINAVVFENAGFQAAFMQLMTDARPDLPIVSHVPKGDKGERASLVSKKAYEGKLFINTNMELYPILQREWLNFGIEGIHDDTLDAVSLVFQFLGLGAISVQSLRKIKSPFLL